MHQRKKLGLAAVGLFIPFLLAVMVSCGLSPTPAAAPTVPLTGTSPEDLLPDGILPNTSYSTLPAASDPQPEQNPEPEQSPKPEQNSKPEPETKPEPAPTSAATESKPKPTPTPTEEVQAPDNDGWNLLLVNPWNSIPEGYKVTLKDIGGGHSVDERCYDDLMDMLEACTGEGLKPVICSSYRTQAKQESLFQNKIERLVKQGYSRDVAEVEAAKVVAVPGTSEHQIGLALDIVDKSYQTLDKLQETTAVQQWLMAHSWEYGFILRYPNEKSDITGIIYEPWHYRYVGKEAAQEIYEQDVCLEEYLDAVHK